MRTHLLIKWPFSSRKSRIRLFLASTLGAKRPKKAPEYLPVLGAFSRKYIHMEKNKVSIAPEPLNSCTTRKFFPRMTHWPFGPVPRYDVVAEKLSRLGLRREEIRLTGHGSLEDALDPGAKYDVLERRVRLCPLTYGSFRRPPRMIAPLDSVQVSGSYRQGLWRRRFALVIAYAPGPDLSAMREEAFKRAQEASSKLCALFKVP